MFANFRHVHCEFLLLSFDIVKIIPEDPNPSSKNFAELRYLLKLEYFDFLYLHFPCEVLTLFAYIFIVIILNWRSEFFVDNFKNQVKVAQNSFCFFWAF